MKKNLFTGLLLAVLALAFTACSAEPKGTEPTIYEAFFASEIVDSSWNETKAKTIKELNLERKTDYLVLWLSDPDLDITEVQISSDVNFDYYYYWDELKYSTDDFWTTLSLGWNDLDEISKERYSMDNKTVYVRVLDSKNNASKIYSINGMTIKKN